MVGPRYTGDVARLHGEWEEMHARLRAQEQILSDAIDLYVRGEGPAPRALMQEVEHMRLICNDRFRKLMDAMNAYD